MFSISASSAEILSNSGKEVVRGDVGRAKGSDEEIEVVFG